MATINEVLSDKLKVPALKPNELIKFSLLKKGKIDPRSDPPQPIPLADYWQSGREVIHDPFLKSGNKNVLILNATGTRPVKNENDGTTRWEPIVEHIKWDNSGELSLGEERFETICFMRRSNKNSSNPFRNKRRKSIYEEVNETISISKKLYDEDLDLNARLWVRDSKIDELKAIAMNLNIGVDNANLDTLRITLLEKVRKDPRSFIIASSNKAAKKKIQVIDAERYEILLFDPVSRAYYYKDDLSKPLCVIPRDEDKLEGILKFFASEKGRGQYVGFANRVKVLYDATVER